MINKKASHRTTNNQFIPINYQTLKGRSIGHNTKLLSKIHSLIFESNLVLVYA
jgi:hypothetical protein